MRHRSTCRRHLGHRLALQGLMHGRRVGFPGLTAAPCVQLALHDAGRLEHAVPGMEGLLALTLVDERHPALENVEHLEVALVLVQAGRVQLMRTARSGLDPDHVRAELPVGGLLDAEIAVLHEGTQPRRIDRVPGPIDAEELRGLAHRTYSFPRLTTSPVSMSISSR